MFSEESKTQQKLFVISTYKKVSQIEAIVSNIHKKKNIPLQLSILGKLTKNKEATKKEIENRITDIKQQLSAILNSEFQFGFFYNPEIGYLFIAGHLTPTFLTKVDERELASLTEGILGIFKGLGIQLKEIKNYLTELKNDNYCLIIRGESTILDGIKLKLSEH